MRPAIGGRLTQRVLGEEEEDMLHVGGLQLGLHQGWSQEGKGRLAVTCLGTGREQLARAGMVCKERHFLLLWTELAWIGWEVGGLGEKGRNLKDSG